MLWHVNKIKFCYSLFTPLPHLTSLQRDIKYPCFLTDCTFKVLNTAITLTIQFYETGFLFWSDSNTFASQPYYYSARQRKTAGFDVREIWIMFAEIWPWNISVLGKCFRFEPRVNGICLMDRSPLGGDVHCMWGQKKLCRFLLLESAQRFACVSKQFLRWINRLQRTSHWSDSSLLLISLPRSQALRGLLFDVLVPYMYSIHSAVVKGSATLSLFFIFATQPVGIVNWFIDCVLCSLQSCYCLWLRCHRPHYVYFYCVCIVVFVFKCIFTLCITKTCIWDSWWLSG